MNLPFFLIHDVETNKMPDFRLPADHPDNARIIQIAAILLDAELNPVQIMARFIVPDGWTIDPGAEAVHGINKEMCRNQGVPIAQAIAEFDALDDQITPHGTLAAYNIKFDAKLVRGERRRLGLPDRYGSTRSFDPMRAATPICKMPPTPAMIKSGRNWYKSPRLGEAYRILLGKEMTGAHDALSDCFATLEVMKALRAAGVDLQGDYPPSKKDVA